MLSVRAQLFVFNYKLECIESGNTLHSRKYDSCCGEQQMVSYTCNKICGVYS